MELIAPTCTGIRTRADHAFLSSQSTIKRPLLSTGVCKPECVARDTSAEWWFHWWAATETIHIVDEQGNEDVEKINKKTEIKEEVEGEEYQENS